MIEPVRFLRMVYLILVSSVFAYSAIADGGRDRIDSATVALATKLVEEGPNGTPELIERIDFLLPKFPSLSNEENDTLRELLRAAGRVRDPRIISWLNNYIDDATKRELVLQEVFSTWPSSFLWTEYLHWPMVRWLVGREEWCDLLQRAIAKTSPPLQRELQKVLAVNFWTPHVTAHFQTLQCDSSPGSEEILIAQSYLINQGLSIDVRKLHDTIDKLGSHEPAVLAEYALAMRHESFVPWLISQLRADASNSNRDRVELALRRVTFVHDLTGYKAWSSWWAKHGKEPRDEWIKSSMERLCSLAKNDPGAGRRYIETLWLSTSYSSGPLYWHTADDPRALEWVVKLAEQPSLGEGIVAWIAFSYRPWMYDEYSPLVTTILEKSSGELSHNAMIGLAVRGLLPHPAFSWTSFANGDIY